MIIAPQTEYHLSPLETLAIYDVRLPGVPERVYRERAGWQESADLEALDADHLVLIVRAGGALSGKSGHGE